MNNVQEINIENLIYEIRCKHVMLDSDLAKLYQCKNGTKSINLAVKRNIDRFPKDFCFRLTKEEFQNLRFQDETTISKNMIRVLPYVFTEEGVAMLSSVLKTDIASKVSIDIMRAFVLMRKYISNSLLEQKFINEMVLSHDKDIKLLQESFDKLENKELKNEIYFEGQIYDAYSKILDIMSKAKNELVIIDGYADKTMLDIIKKLKCKVTLITKTKSLLNKLDLEKYNKQYNNLEIIYNDTFHDRYFILDKKQVYHCGTSINHIGSKTFSINKIEEDIVISSLLDKISKIS